MSEAQLARWRTRHVGFIFQFYHLLPVLSAYENVELPLLLVAAFGRAAQAAGADGPGTGRPERPLVASARPAFRRPAAARRHRPRHRDRSDADRGRRADRRSRRQKRDEILDLLGELHRRWQKRSSWSPTTNAPPIAPIASCTWIKATWWNKASPCQKRQSHHCQAQSNPARVSSAPNEI